MSDADTREFGESGSILIANLLGNCLRMLDGSEEIREGPFGRVHIQVMKLVNDGWEQDWHGVRDSLKEAVETCYPKGMSRERKVSDLIDISYRLSRDLSMVEDIEKEWFQEFLRVWHEALQEPFELVAQ